VAGPDEWRGPYGTGAGIWVAIRRRFRNRGMDRGRPCLPHADQCYAMPRRRKRARRARCPGGPPRRISVPRYHPGQRTQPRQRGGRCGGPAACSCPDKLPGNVLAAVGQPIPAWRDAFAAWPSGRTRCGRRRTVWGLVNGLLTRLLTHQREADRGHAAPPPVIGMPVPGSGRALRTGRPGPSAPHGCRLPRRVRHPAPR
jgi:hypothetical protein